MERCTSWGKGVRFLIGCGVAVGIVLGVGMIPAHALTVRTVTKSEDSETTEGTLRYWVKNASAGDVISFSGNGTAVNLTSTLTFDKNLVLAGPATITQTGSGCVLSVPSGKGVGMAKLTILGGKGTSYGGGVANAGTLQMTECIVRNNSASGSGAQIVPASSCAQSKSSRPWGFSTKPPTSKMEMCRHGPSVAALARASISFRRFTCLLP